MPLHISSPFDNIEITATIPSMKLNNESVQSTTVGVTNETETINNGKEVKLTKTELDECVEKINQLHKEIEVIKIDMESLGTKSLDRGIEIGKILIKVKWSLPHGHFRPWIKNNCKFTYRTGQNYMSLVKGKQFSLLVNCNGLTESYIKLGLMKPKKQSKSGEKSEGKQPKSKTGKTGDEPSEQTEVPKLDLPKQVEEMVDNLEEILFGHEDDEDSIYLLEPLVELYNNFQHRHSKNRNVKQEPITVMVDLNETDTRVLTK